MAGSRVHTGSFIGTGAEKTVNEVGFRPRVVVLFNTTDAKKGEWQNTMPDASLFITKDHDSDQHSFATSNGVTPTAQGFTIGADGEVNVSAKQVHWQAWE
jgi:hypothetical protein